MKRIVALCLVMAIAMMASSCGDKGFLTMMFDLETRSMKNAPPSTVKELQDAIARYGKDVERTTAAMEKVGMYWRLLAVKYMNTGLYGDAYDAARTALHYYPETSSLYYVAAVSAAYLSKTASIEIDGAATTRESWLDVAERAYKQSLQIDPSYAKALYGLGVLYSFELNNHEAALAPLETLLSTDPKNVDALFVYARSLYGAGRLQDAANAYDRIIATTPVEAKKKQATDNKKQVLDELYGK
ncbi:MAG TPA: tetratricopeptide repeat protein [bacterium]|nr:tetratricopeptide repeat protein [bacterium]